MGTEGLVDGVELEIASAADLFMVYLPWYIGGDLPFN
jgi:hypothetical protein